MNDDARTAVETVFRREYGLILAALVRRCGDFCEAEEAMQEAFARACVRWESTGVPRNPAAWLLRVAIRYWIDRMRRRQRDSDAVRDLAEFAGDEANLPAAGEVHGDEASVPDERLRLVFTCCHPALAEDVRVVLTLNTLCGMTAAELARVFLVTEATMAQRLVRAKRRIREARIPYRVPEVDELAPRLSSVLAVVYLIYNEAYSLDGEKIAERRVLGGEALRLVRMLESLLPDDAEIAGLNALLSFLEARRDSRSDSSGRFVPLEDQDRAQWDRGLVCEGREWLERAIRRGAAGPYVVQAAIAAVHCDAERFEDTDWLQIVGLYDRLLVLTDSPVVALNRAVAVAEVRGPEAGLTAIEEARLRESLASYFYLHTTLATLGERAGHPAEHTRAAWMRARELASNDTEREFIDAKLGRSDSPVVE